jgi:uncharacterized protein YndB with AHSA1/START domain
MQRIEKVIEIAAPIERVFDLFSDFENFPRWMRHIRDVHYSGRRYTRWTADAPLGTSVEWEAETTAFDPPHLIAWESVRGDVDTEGEVSFRETRRGTTLMHVMMGYRPPAGRLGALVASLFGKDPERQLEEDLERFAEVVERGANRNRRRRHSFREQPGDRERSEPYRGREFDYEDQPRPRRTARDDENPYDHPDQRFRDERAERRLDFDEEWDERLGQPPERGRRGEEEDAPRWRHAMTPREHERMSRERQPDTDYSRETFRRGVDKLMDMEPPSRRWRRWD